MVCDLHMKLESLIYLGEVCKLLHKYDEALRFFKKALEYCTFLILLEKKL